MRNNKGYSLFELLISIAIFSLVMVGIISIMNTTSVFYRGGQQEVRLQEEAQVALNQVEELLIDLDDRIVTVNNSAGAREYKVYKNSISYGLKQDGDRLMYKEVGASGDSGWVLMAEGITEFKISGFDYDGGTDRDTGDNRVSVNVGVRSGKYEYTAKKDVYFRNAVENETLHKIPQSTSGGSGSEEVEYDYEYIIRRGEKLNLFSEFNIVSDIALTQGSSMQVTSYFDLTQVDDSTTGITDAVVTVKSPLLTSFTSTIGANAKLGVSGKDSKGEMVNVLLMVESVQPIVDVPVFQFTVDSSTNAGSPKWVEFKGIDFRGFSNLKYDLVFYNDNNNNNGVYDDGTDTIHGTRVTDVAFGTPSNVFSGVAKVNVGVRVCQNTGFAVVYQHNDKLTTSGKDFLESSKKYLYVKIKVNGVAIDQDKLVFRALAHGSGF